MTKTVAGGTLPLFLTAWKGAREGIHYPIGDVYFDLANYAQEVNGITTQSLANAITDSTTAELTGDPNRLLWKSDMSNLAVSVNRATHTGSIATPMLAGFVDPSGTVRFRESQAGELGVSTTFVGPEGVTAVTDFCWIEKLPRCEDGDAYNLYIAGPAYTYNNSLDPESVVTYSYSADGISYISKSDVSDWRSIRYIKADIDRISELRALETRYSLTAEKATLGEPQTVKITGTYSYNAGGEPQQGTMTPGTFVYIDSQYIVEIYYQEAGAYPNTASRIISPLYGTAGDRVALEPDEYVKDNYVVDEAQTNILSGEISEQDSLILKIYFKQQFTVTYDPGEHGTWNPEHIKDLDYGVETPAFSGDTDTEHDPGYIFSGWDVTPADTVTETVTYIAQWTANTDTPYTVEFYYQTNGEYGTPPDSTDDRTGTTDTEVSVTDDDKISEKENYVLDEIMNDFYTGTIAADGSLVLKVYFKEQFSVTYDPGEHGTWTAETVENLNYGENTPEFSGDVKEEHDPGYTFGGWTPGIADTVTKSVEYVAQWTADSDTKYRVEYYYQMNGEYSDAPSDYVERSGETDTEVSVIDADKETAKEGYVYDEAANNILSGTIAGDGSLVLKVYFKQQITITFDLDGGTLNGSTGSIKLTQYYGDEITILDAPERDGFVFLYWKGSEYLPGDSYTVTEDHTFTAQWEEEEIPVVTYTITYTDGVDGETIFADQVYTVEEGEKTPGFNGMPVREGYTFKGWSPEVSDTVTGNAVYTAQWEKTAKPDNPTKPDSPKTGDESNLWFWIALALISLLSCSVIVCLKRKNAKTISNN